MTGGVTFTTAEVAERLRCSVRKVRSQAAALGIGANLSGRAGYRYTDSEIDQLWESMRPVQPVERRRRKKAS